MMTDRDRQAALLAQAYKELAAEQALSAESQRQLLIANEMAVELRRQLNSNLSVENINLQGRLDEALEEVDAWRTEATALRPNVELFAKRAAESERQVTLLNAQLVEARRQIDRLRNLLDLADRAVAEANVQIESLGAQLIVALEEVERLRLEANN
jgi:chemotaxis protein MotB